MEAHAALAGAGFEVRSFGTGSSVKLPGPSFDKPNVYAFGTPYATMHSQLVAQNEALYKANGVLAMLDRNQKIKKAPERWQDALDFVCDVAVTFEERVFEAVLDDFAGRTPTRYQPVFVINVETKDTHSDAAVGAQVVLRLCQALEQATDLEEQVEGICSNFEQETGNALLLSPQYY